MEFDDLEELRVPRYRYEHAHTLGNHYNLLYLEMSGYFRDIFFSLGTNQFKLCGNTLKAFLIAVLTSTDNVLFWNTHKK